jgi:hypothetical protein
MNEHSSQAEEERWERSIRRWMSWFGVVGAALFALTFFASIAWISVYGAWDQIARRHFAAVVGLPSAALAAFFVVVVLRTVAGPVEMKVLGFEFRGASGPIVMWIACFLAIAWLWPLQYQG